MGTHSSSWSSANLQKVNDDKNREDDGKYEYTMPGVSGATALHEKEKPHSKSDFLKDLNSHLKKQLDTTQLATGSSRIAQPPGTKPAMCPAKLPPPARLLPPARQPPQAKPTPPPKPT